ncbi:flagellar filament capping protein FliD [Geothrix sp. PMB-07]|uniref:flagellar filament capping protein FliD n=1 Tax=Geothrix sp. PMB-07 TaxID=3068640 RepID=UPI0027417A1E|nr:flagellar filament capping protein FliD [Geothrix sp. PMB-07]WLT31806.1 flagellar filament capping protein FliD [Geothrix sp. PMB-07]
MATTNASSNSLNGVATGIDTTALINAMVAQKSGNLNRLQAKKTQNDARSTALTAMRTSLSALTLSMAALQDRLNNNAVASTDINNTYVTATAKASLGAASGSFDINVASVATKARISTTSTFQGSSSNPAVLTYTSSTAKTTTRAITFNITANDGAGNVAGTFTVGGNTYNLTGTNGTLSGQAGTPLEGLKVSVTGSATGAGTLTLSTTTTMAASDPTAAIFSGGNGTASFAIKGTDGTVTAFNLTDNSLNGLRSAINANSKTVTATIINTGAGANPYQLVLTAKDTGTGKTGGVITLADVTAPGGATVNASLGITAGTLTGTISAPTGLTGGLTSDMSGASAKDAVFTLNGIQLTRQSNVVSDASDGMTFTLKQGGQTGTTTLTVTPDKINATTAMQDFIAKYNQFVKDYKAASQATKNTDGSVALAPLSNDPSARAFMADLKAALASTAAGIPGTDGYKTWASLGVTNLADGSLMLNNATFQNALTTDLTNVQKLFTFSGTTTNPNVTFKSAGPSTVTGPVDFSITKDGNGALWGTFTRNGVTSSPVQVSSDGTLTGTGDYAGLVLNVTGTGTGTLNLVRGPGRTAVDLINKFTNTNGTITTLLNSITTQNAGLAKQIQAAQSLVDSQTTQLKAKFAEMERVVGQMKASAGSLIGG